MIFTDSVLRQITADIAVHPPELGGALLGPKNSELITDFIFDPHAETTRVSYFPSTSLAREVQEFEKRNNQLVFKGIVHSHPGLDRPSGQDLVAFGKGLNLNPHLPCFVAPIISDRESDDLQGHELALNESKKMSLYCAWRQLEEPLGATANQASSETSEYRVVSREVLCSPEDIGEMGCLAFAEKVREVAADILKTPIETLAVRRELPMTLNDSHFENVAVSSQEHDFEIMCMIPAGYPFVKPNLLYTTPLSGESTTTVEVPLNWQMGTTALSRFILPETLRNFIHPHPQLTTL